MHLKSFTYKFIVGCVVYNIDDTSLASDSLTAPGKISLVQTQSTIFFVTPTAADSVDPLGSKFGHGSWTSQFELPLHANGVALAAGRPAFMPMVS